MNKKQVQMNESFSVSVISAATYQQLPLILQCKVLPIKTLNIKSCGLSRVMRTLFLRGCAAAVKSNLPNSIQSLVK